MHFPKTKQSTIIYKATYYASAVEMAVHGCVQIAADLKTLPAGAGGGVGCLEAGRVGEVLPLVGCGLTGTGGNGRRCGLTGPCLGARGGCLCMDGWDGTWKERVVDVDRGWLFGSKEEDMKRNKHGGWETRLAGSTRRNA